MRIRRRQYSRSTFVIFFLCTIYATVNYGTVPFQSGGLYGSIGPVFADPSPAPAPSPSKPVSRTPPVASNVTSTVNNASYVGYSFDTSNINSVHADWQVVSHAPFDSQQVVRGVVFTLIGKGGSIDMLDTQPYITVGTQAYDDPVEHMVHYRVSCSFSASGSTSQNCGTDAFEVSPGDTISVDAARIDAGQWFVTLRNASGWSHSTRTIFMPGIIGKTFVGVYAPTSISQLIKAHFNLVQVNGQNVGDLQSQSWVVTRADRTYTPSPIGVQGFDIISHAA